MNKKSKNQKIYIFKTPSFIEGIARVLDLGLTLDSHEDFFTHLSGDEIDCLSLKSDWRAVGNDLKTSIKKYEQKEKDPKGAAPAAACATTIK